jgi:hypothetical protein
VLEGGKVVAHGTHTELLATSPLYRDTYALQLKTDDDASADPATSDPVTPDPSTPEPAAALDDRSPRSRLNGTPSETPIPVASSGLPLPPSGPAATPGLPLARARERGAGGEGRLPSSGADGLSSPEHTQP